MRVERAPGRKPVASLFDFQPWPAGEEPAKLLSRLAAAHDLDRSQCTTVLDTADYSLLLTEAPDVPAEELRAAIRWRIKDLIDFHINDATIDVFEVPGEKATGRTRPMYAVAARSAVIQKRVDLMETAGVRLEVIDIPEMAQRNVASLLPEDVKGAACLSFAPASGLLTITRQAELYLSRNLDIGFERLTGGDDPVGDLDRIVLEVQRSLDYYESHFRQPPVAVLAVAPPPRAVAGLVDHLKANLNVTVRVVDLRELVECPHGVTPELASRCFITLGAALRQEVAVL